VLRVADEVADESGIVGFVGQHDLALRDLAFYGERYELLLGVLECRVRMGAGDGEAEAMLEPYALCLGRILVEAPGDLAPLAAEPGEELDRVFRVVAWLRRV
jgi:hypothetical protein